MVDQAYNTIGESGEEFGPRLRSREKTSRWTRLQHIVTRIPKHSLPTFQEIVRWEDRTRILNILTNAILILIFMACATLLILLFVTPRSLRVRGHIYPPRSEIPSIKSFSEAFYSKFSRDNIKPQVVVTLVSSLLTVSAFTLITRLVEHDLWLSLNPFQQPAKSQTVVEVSNMAAWLGSWISKLTYLCNGSSLPLKVCGIALLPLAFTSTLLVAGIGQHDFATRNVTYTPSSSPGDDRLAFNGFAPYFNDKSTKLGHDLSTTLAFLGIASPFFAKGLCQSDRDCHINATTPAAQANCKPRVIAKGSSSFVAVVQSNFDPNLRVTLNDDRFISFRTSNFTEKGLSFLILGTLRPAPNNTPTDITAIEWSVCLGKVSIEQTGNNNVSVLRDTFVRLREFHDHDDMSDRADVYFNQASFPDIWTFDVEYTNFESVDSSQIGLLMATHISSGDFDSSVSSVSSAIEMAFDYSTIISWANDQRFSDITITNTTTERRYTYRPTSLFILLAPAFAIIFAAMGRLQVGGAYTVPGYDPIVIAARGLSTDDVNPASAHRTLFPSSSAVGTASMGEIQSQIPDPACAYSIRLPDDNELRERRVFGTFVPEVENGCTRANLVLERSTGLEK